MISLLLCLALQPVPLVIPTSPLEWTVEDPKEEYKRRREEAGKDLDALWSVYEWCEAFGLGKEGRSCLRAILKIDKEHEGANKALGHLFHDGKWFKTQKKLDAYKEQEELRKAEEEGLVKYEGEWVAKDDLPYLKRGMMRDDGGNWVDEETYKRTQEGWLRQDLTWISPEEKTKADEGLWKCEEEWLSLEDANEYHSELDQWWTIPTDYFVIYSTCKREVVMKTVDHMDRAFRELSRIYGSAPKEPVPVFVLKSQEQYSALASGQGRELGPSETHGLSSIHYAFFADALLMEGNKDLEWFRCGVGYWDDGAENGARWGTHSVRHAAAQSFAEALDPSPEAVNDFKSSKQLTTKSVEKYRDEKRVPEWFRVGAVTYSERYFVDNLVSAGGNPYWARDWSIQNILNKGGLDSIKDILDGELSINDPEGSTKQMNVLGLVMAFMLDGKVPALKQSHAAVKAALKSDKDGAKEFKALSKVLIKHEEEFRKFAGV